MTKQPLLYIAGPYTHPDPVANTRRMVKIADALIPRGVTPLIPHMTLLWHMVRPRSYDFWLEYDLRLVERCDALLRVPGASRGADAEVIHARDLEIPVLQPVGGRISDCVSAVRDWILNSYEEG